jgi:hypothetical protein
LCGIKKFGVFKKLRLICHFFGLKTDRTGVDSGGKKEMGEKGNGGKYPPSPKLAKKEVSNYIFLLISTSRLRFPHAECNFTRKMGFHTREYKNDTQSVITTLTTVTSARTRVISTHRG